MTLDLAAEPASAAGEGFGDIVLRSIPSASDGRAFEIEMSLPLSIDEVFRIEDVPIVGTFEFGLTATGTVVAGGQFEVPATMAPALQPGDANQDLQFDQRDIAAVLRSAKYLSGRPATWGEGDWNGAPGGTLGDPPVVLLDCFYKPGRSTEKLVVSVSMAITKITI